MTDPLAPLIFQRAFQDTDSAITESLTISGTTFVLGSTLNPPYPSGALLIPKGAGPYADLVAPTTGPALTSGNLVDNGDYHWAISLVTDWGDTKPVTQLHVAGIGSGKHGYTLNLPGYTARADNPPRKLRVWRTVSGGSQLYLVTELGDLSVTEYVDEVSDDELTVLAPTTNTSGMIGVLAVDVFDGSSHWTEVALGTTLTSHHFSVDYTITATGGTVHFAGADIGTAVTITYFAGTMLGSTYLNQYWTAFAGVYEWARSDATAVFSHGLQVTADLEVLGNTDLDGTLDVASTSTFNALLTSSSVHVTGSSTLDGTVLMGSTLHVVGAAQLDSSLTVNGNATVGGTLGVTGLATLSGGLSTTGGGSFSGNVSVGGTLTVTGASTLNGGLSVTGTGSVSGNLSTGGTLSVAGTSALTGLVTIGSGGGLHILGGPPDFQVANIFGSGSSVVTIGHSTNHQDLGVTGVSNLNTVHVANPNILYTNYLQSETGALVTFNNEVMVTGWFHPVKLLADKGSSAQVLGGAVSGSILAFVGSHNDSFGLIHYQPGGSPTSGDQFQVQYSASTIHSAIPAVLLTCLYNGIHNVKFWQTSASTNIDFIVNTADIIPTTGEDYYIAYMVMN